MQRLRILMLVLVPAMAGCLGVGNDDNGDDRDNDANVEYSGAEAGRHSETAECNADGQLTVTAAIDDGDFTVEVMSGDGMTLHMERYGGTLDGETESLEGAAGPWTVTVTRADGFSGAYNVLLVC